VVEVDGSSIFLDLLVGQTTFATISRGRWLILHYRQLLLLVVVFVFFLLQERW
jgi:hypothetical protein